MISQRWTHLTLKLKYTLTGDGEVDYSECNKKVKIKNFKL